MTARRAYNLGKRAGAVAETRRRILDAAVELFRSKGFQATSLQEVARRADLASATVLYHFDKPSLIEAAIAHLVEQVRFPDQSVFAGTADLRGRVDRFVHELFAVYDRGSGWFEMHLREKSEVAGLAEAEANFFSVVRGLAAVALGPAAEDHPQVLGALLALTNPGNLGALQRAGLSSEQAADIMVELLVPWIEQHVNSSDNRTPDERRRAGPRTPS